jgi:hypothetical protein
MDEKVIELKHGPRMRLHFNVHEPIELVEMTLAFQGLGFEYQNFIKQFKATDNQTNHTSEVKLYITKIETNCILAEMAPALPMLGALAPIFSDVNTITDFVKNISSLIDWLRTANSNKGLKASDIPYSKKKLRNVRDLVSLVGKNQNGTLGISAIKYEEETAEDKIVLEMKFLSQHCREAESGANKALQILDNGEKADKEKVLMYFFQTNTDDPKSGGRTGDKAIISSVTDKPLSVYVISEIDQNRIRNVLDDKTHNPLLTGFVVDVNIEKDRKGEPKIFRVLRVHDVEYDDGE